MIFLRSLVAIGAFAFAAAAPAAHAADMLTINYFTIAETDRDANHLAGGTFDNEVMDTLGPAGLPVLNTAANGGVGLPSDIDANGEITYWSPSLNNGGPSGHSDVSFTSSATVTLPFSVPQNFFPPNGTGPNDANGFQAATLTGNLDAPTTEQISFSIGADDMAFAFLDGHEVCDLGGVHSATAGTCVSPFDISAGTHKLAVFFVDINQVQSGLVFDVITTGVTTTPTSGVPEPGIWTMMLAGFSMLGFVMRRSRRNPLRSPAQA